MFFGTGIIVITFFIALLFHKKNKPEYYKFIFIFILLGILLSLNSIFNNTIFWRSNKKAPQLVQELLLLFQYILLSLYFINLFANSLHSKKIIKLLLISIILQASLIAIIFSTDIDINPSFISSVFLLIFCSFYVKDLMANNPTLVLIKSSAFWITMGIFFYSSVSFPINTLIKFVPRSPEYINLRSQIFSIWNMSLIVLYLLIIKSYLCLRHQQSL